MSTAAAIETQGLGKRYDRLTALDGLSLRVDPGEIFGFLGPNGAGKTTGGATVLGHDVRTEGAAWRREIGYLPGDLALWPAVTGAGTLEFLERLMGRPATARGEVLERLRLSDADLDRRIGTYSDGMRQKIGIVQAFQCVPRLVLLDEPTKGLDPLIQLAFYELLVDFCKRGTTIFFSSHVLPEVERVCHRVAMLRGGKLAGVGDVEELRRTLPRRATITFNRDIDPDDLAGLGTTVVMSGRHAELLVPADRVPALVAKLATMPLVDVLIEPPSLEDAFLERYR
jgi:beta-exotoxin I transport system ATP-binding protein